MQDGSAISAYPEKICNLAERSELLGLEEFYDLEERLYGPILETEGSFRKELKEKRAARKGASGRLLI